MQKVIYKNQGGLGIILDQNESETDVFKQEPIEVGTSVLLPGAMTTLYGFFEKEARYVGTYYWENTNLRMMVFCAGSEKDLFDTQTYYYLLAYISPTMIANKYSENTARGYQLKNGQWK